MFDVNKERETFEAWLIKKFDLPPKSFSLDFNDGVYDSIPTQARWEAWKERAKAQAVPEGYVLLPRVPTEKMFQAYERYSVAPMSTLSKTGYKAMVEAASESGAEG
ncbi:hypothetical protein Q4388_18450 [Acinetobacter baumannii]|uniref:hypothetical protein n=1 Tax=Acinetobacter baumannii TaxID=470 RepID=UPI00094C89E6|nr:hypothetical protein [Acinetobacter baumannii]PNH14016.1 hypothetical protein DSM30011_012870 [Acinetobacter baumannii]UMO41704.1 hypothetical protein L2Z44_10740 [Acinetobacter baumannii]HCA4901593.1 hypothetical protein [Acinetobacter baumannii]